MPTFEDPIADSEQARVALRGLAHATRNIGHPGDAYEVIGELIDGLRSLEQVLDQLAKLHVTNRRWAFGEDRDHVIGTTEAQIAGATLHRAARLVGRTQADLEVALQHSGRILWIDASPAVGDHDLHIAGPGDDMRGGVSELGL